MAGSFAAVPISTPLDAHPWAAPALFSAAPPALGAHPWAALTLFSAAPPILLFVAPPVFTTATATVAPLPAQQSAPSTGGPNFDLVAVAVIIAKIDRCLALLDSFRVDPVLQQGGVAVNSAVIATPSSTTSPTVPPTAAVTAFVHQAAAVRLQVAARGLLARRQVRRLKMLERQVSVVVQL